MSGIDFPLRIPLDGKNLDKLIGLLQKAGKEANLTEKEIADIEKQLKKVGQEGPNQINKVNQSMDNFVSSGVKKLGGAVVAAFAIDRVIAFGKAVIDITAEFQKAEAVLTNTLGSKSAAQQTLRAIESFASKTPFSVQQLTNSFVKLANQGFVPTNNELTKLGDLAASTGKDFDQLTEAIIDAQTLEFERLKEFGIRARKEGDNVTFTFKGLQTTVKGTAEEIRNYILSLGDASGVSGSMAAISKTLGGRISNLGDSWDTFLRTLGDGNKGALSGTVTLLDEALKIATDLVKTTEQRNSETQTRIANSVFEEFKAKKSLGEQEAYLNLLYKRKVEAQIENVKAEKDWGNASYKRYQQNQRDVKIIGEALLLIADYKKGIEAAAQAKKDAEEADKLAKETDALKRKRQEFEKANKEWDGVVDREIEEARIAEELAKKQERLNKLLEERNTELRIQQSIEESLRDAQREFAEEDEKQMKESNDSLTKDREKKLKEDKDFLDGMLQNRLEFNDYVRDAAQGLANELFELDQARFEAEMQSLEMARNREIELAGDNAEAKKRINRKYDEEQRKLKQKQAQSDKDQALFNILVNTAQGVMAALASVPPNVPLSVAIGFTGAAQAAIVSSRPLPKFAKGVYDLQGPGTPTSDSIMAMLSPHESVVPAKQSQKFGWLLKPLIEEDLTLMELKNLVDKNIPVNLRGDLFQSKTISDSSELISEMRLTRKAIEGKKEMHIDINENGFRAWSRKNNQWSQYVSNRYKF